MKSQQLKTLKGFRDFLPNEVKKRQWLKDKMVSVFESWGYEPLETPTLEPLELFAGVIGEDEKLFFRFKDQGGREVALRYDQTVPTCRFIGENFDKITFPFRRYQIQSAFRAEKPQKGRFREFTQSDIDIFGVASPTGDAEIIAATLDLYKTLGFRRAVALINNRDLLKNIPYRALVAIDKFKKIGEDGVIDDMISKDISKKEAREYLNYVQNLKPDKTITIIFDYLKNSGIQSDWYQFDPTIVRALAYSQGPIWEIVIPEYSVSSVGGGERYDDLVEKISGKKVPGTGIGIGFDRTLEALEELKLLPDLASTTKVLVSVFSKELARESIEVAKRLREQGINTELYPEDAKVDKQLKYADKKGIAYVIIIGPEEIKGEKVVLKNLKTGEQKRVKPENLASLITHGTTPS